MRPLVSFTPALVFALFLSACAALPTPRDRVIVSVPLTGAVEDAHARVAEVLAERGFQILTNTDALVATDWFTIDKDDLDRWGYFGRSYHHLRLREGAGRIHVALRETAENQLNADVILELAGYWDERRYDGQDREPYRRRVTAYSNGRLERQIAEALAAKGPSS